MFVHHTTDERALLLFSVACLKRGMYLTADARMSDRLEAIERVVQGHFDPSLLQEWSVEPELNNPQSLVEYHLAEAINYAVWLAQRAPGEGFGPGLEMEGDQVGRALAVAQEVRLAFAYHQYPERNWDDFELPPELEPFHHKFDDPEIRRAIRRSPTQHPEADAARIALSAAREEYNRMCDRTEAAEDAVMCDLYREVFPYPFGESKEGGGSL